MAQGNHKLGKAKKSAGAEKRKTVKTVKKTKKGNSSLERNKGVLAATKAINKKNERLIASKALNSGANFSLGDISEKGKFLSSYPSTEVVILPQTFQRILYSFAGKHESKRQTADRDKKQNKPTKLSQRLQVRLNKLKK